MSKPALTPALRTQLQRIQQQLKTQPQVTWKLKGPVIKQLLHWCDAWDLDVNLWPGGKECVFDRPFLLRVEQLLRDEGLPPLGFIASGKTSQQQAMAGLEEHKSVREAPSVHRVLVSLPCPETLQLPGLMQPTQRLELDLDWRQLDAAAFGALLVVENLDCFYQFNTPDAVPLPEGLQQALIVYRGHAHEAKGCKALKESWAALGKPRIYLGDFDAKGVSIALHEGYSHLLLPEAAWLQQQARALHQPDAQVNELAALRTHLHKLPDDHPLRPLLQLLLNQKGLKQQWYSSPLQLTALH